MATNGTVDISKLAKVLTEKIDNWDREVDKVLSKDLFEVTEEAKEMLVKNTASPRRKGSVNLRESYDYKPKAKSTRNGKHKRTLFSSEYRLAHLIEDGHKVYRRAAGTKYVIGSPKTGPLVIKRVYPTDPSLAKSQAPLKTSKYEMWKKAEGFAKRELYRKIVNDLKSLNKI